MEDFLPSPDTTPAAPPDRASVSPAIPDYLDRHYRWAYLTPRAVRIFDHAWVVSAILWGQYRKLQNAALAEITPGTRVFQAACVYGDLSARLARHLGPTGRLDVIDIAPIQVAHNARKLADLPQASVRLADAAAPGPARYDVVLSFFLLHEVPDIYKRRIVAALLEKIAPGGKAVFIDYHRPAPLHPLTGPMILVLDHLEPFARSLWRHDIAAFAPDPGRFTWEKTTLFGGLYQKVVVRRH